MGPKELYLDLARKMYEAGYIHDHVGIIEVAYLIQDWDQQGEEDDALLG